MHTLDDLLAPITPDQFYADYYDRKPLHIPAEGRGKDALLTWATFNRLLNQSSIWTPNGIRLVHNNQPIPPEQYCLNLNTPEGEVIRPSPAKVEMHLARGASLIANETQALTPKLAVISEALGQTFGAQIGANVYCSFQNVQAFGTHFDLHDVFVVQTEGEKLWRIYEARADRPVSLPQHGDEVRDWFARTRGRVMMEIRMKKGDVLYVPRGCYHDAIAVDGPSLHVTLSSMPLYGRILFRLLEAAALQDPDFRAWLAPAKQDNGRTLQRQLSELGQKLARLTALPEFRDEVAMTQQRLVQKPAAFDLPARKAVTLYRPTGRIAPQWFGPVVHAMQWAFGQSQFALEDMIAQFDFVAEADLRAAVEAAEKAGALARL